MTFLQKLICITCFFLFASNHLVAQKILQIEKVGSHKLIRYFPGNVVTFKLEDKQGWFTRKIEDIDANQNLVLFEGQGFVNIKDIVAIQKAGGQQKWKSIGTSLYFFGLNWGFWSLAATLVDDELTWLAAIVPASAFVLGYLMKSLGKSKVWKIGKKRRLRVLDLGFSMAVA